MAVAGVYIGGSRTCDGGGRILVHILVVQIRVGGEGLVGGRCASRQSLGMEFGSSVIAHLLADLVLEDIRARYIGKRVSERTPFVINGSLEATEGWNSPCLAASAAVLALMMS